MNGFEDNRPDPDELLASLKNEEEKRKLGKLKIFFGMCAGVGKTYTMLQTMLKRTIEKRLWHWSRVLN
jgi:two-component system sensor histidine kinase KdpD